MNRLLAGLAGLALAAGSLVAATPVHAASPAPLVAAPAPVPPVLLPGETVPDAGPPPTPSKNDRPYKSTARDRAALKGNVNAEFTTFACPCYNYVKAEENLTGGGATATSFAANLPSQAYYVKSGAGVNDYHSLAQLAVTGGTSGSQVVEFGVTVDPSLFGDSQPRLFAGIRKNGVFQGYGTGFVDYTAGTASPYTYGSVVPVGQKRLQIIQSSSVWWMAFDGAYVGYFPNTLWTGSGLTFTTGSLFQAFLEVVSRNVQTCSDAGTGYLPGNVNVGRIGSLSLTGLNPSTTVLSYVGAVVPSTAIGFGVSALSAETFEAGGPGANAALTGVGSTGSC